MHLNGAGKRQRRADLARVRATVIVLPAAGFLNIVHLCMVLVQDWVGASVKHRRLVEWAPGAELQLREACINARGETGGKVTLRFFAGDPEHCKR